MHGWWENGHFYTGRAAAEALPPQMPAFFRQSVDRLSYLNYEPDRWKNSAERAADQALVGGTSPEHYINFEKVPPGLLKLTNRFDFLAAISRREPNGSKVGLLPYRILEMFQSLRVSFRLWREAPDAGTKAWIEQRIIDDAGILGHYVADGANPLHTTVHHNGWVGKNNPRKFTTDNTLHGRFEGKYVDGHIKIEDIRPRVGAQAKVIAQPREAIVRVPQRQLRARGRCLSPRSSARSSRKRRSPPSTRRSSSIASLSAPRSCAICGGRRTAPRISRAATASDPLNPCGTLEIHVEEVP